jgi:DNA polymerase III epsilon subunit family exonuclease
MEALIWIALIGAALVGWQVYSKRNQTQKAVEDARRRLSILPERFIVLDIETTGLKPEKDEIIEVAAIRVNRDSQEHDSFRAFVKPRRKIPEKITSITGITQEMVERDGEPIEQVIRHFHEFVGEHRIVAFNAEFDMAFLRRDATAVGLEFRNEVSCALDMARRAWPKRRSYKLKDLANDGGLDTSDSHRALGDCKRALTIYTAAVAQLQRIS